MCVYTYIYMYIYTCISATVPLHWKAYGSKAPRSGHYSPRLFTDSVMEYTLYTEYTLYQPQVPQISKMLSKQYFFEVV